MPLFMDIHYATQATAREIAELHQLDVDRQDEYACKMMTYWFDEKRGFVFCLVECENKEALLLLHRNTHYQEPHKIIEVDANLVELFLGRLSDPEIPNPENEFEHFISETAFRTLMLVELRRYEQKVKKNPFIKSFYKLIEDSLTEFSGTEVNRKPGEIMASFVSSNNAVKCVLKIQKSFMEYKRKNSKNTLDVAIGLSIGPPVDEKNAFFGETILTTKRLCEIAYNGRIILSSEFNNVDESELNKSYKKLVKVLKSSEEEFLSKLMEATEQSWNDEKFNVDSFSKKVGLSKSQLYRKMTSLTGFSPNEFIREYRLKKAVEMLERKKGNISQIAFETGFSNVSYFSKCFHKKFGWLPSDYYRNTA